MKSRRSIRDFKDQDIPAKAVDGLLYLMEGKSSPSRLSLLLRRIALYLVREKVIRFNDRHFYDQGDDIA